MESVVYRVLSDAVLYGLPVEFRVSGSTVVLRYKSRRTVYRILATRGVSGDVRGVALAIPGLEAFSVKVFEVSEAGARVLWENIPLAVGLDRDFMSPAETDLWLRRFKMRGSLSPAREPPEALRGLAELGFVVLSSSDGFDYAVADRGVVALWFVPLTGRVDLAMEVQERMGLWSWGGRLEAVRSWVEGLKR